MAEESFATPVPAGLLVLAFYLGGLFPVLSGMASHQLISVLVPLGLAGGIVQLIAGVIELKNRSVLSGNVMCAFSAFMFLGMGENLLKGAGMMPLDSAAVDCCIFLIMGIAMIGFTPGFLNSLASAFFMFTTDVFFCSAGLAWLLNSDLLLAIAAWDLPLVIFFIFWQVIAIVLNTHFKKKIISMGPPLLKMKSS